MLQSGHAQRSWLRYSTTNTKPNTHTSLHWLRCYQAGCIGYSSYFKNPEKSNIPMVLRGDTIKNALKQVAELLGNNSSTKHQQLLQQCYQKSQLHDNLYIDPSLSDQINVHHQCRIQYPSSNLIQLLSQQLHQGCKHHLFQHFQGCKHHLFQHFRRWNSNLWGQRYQNSQLWYHNNYKLQWTTPEQLQNISHDQ